MKAPHRVVVTGTGLVPQAVTILTGIGADLVEMGGPVTAASLAECLRAAPTQAILMRGNPPIDATVLAQAPFLQVIAKHGAGVDSIDIAAATAAGVLVTVAGEANAPAVAEHTIALILSLARDIPMLADASRAGRWLRGGYTGRELRGRTLGIVGFGRIGRRVAEMALALGLSVIALGRRRDAVDMPSVVAADSLAALLSQSDIVSLHAPLTPETRRMIGREAIARMRPGAIIVNTARGALVDETALREALHAGHLAGAALDTLANEPPDPDDPILSAPNLIVTPHVAAMTAEAIVRMGVGAASNIAAVLTGGRVDPRNVVNSQVLASA